MFAGGARGTDETGTNKDTHQLPVISMGTLIDVPAPIFSCQFCLQWDVANPRTTMPLFSLYSTLFDDVFGLYSILFDVDSGHDAIRENFHYSKGTT